MAKKIKEIIINIGKYIIGYACLLLLLPFILAFVNEIGEREKRGIPVFLGFPDDDVFFQDEENCRKYAEAMEKSGGKLGMDYLSMAMVYDATTNEEYMEWWTAYIQRWNELMPEIPLYCNFYYDVYNEKIQDYYTSPVVKKNRSMMNVVFVTGDKELDAKFASEAAKAGFKNLKGHRIVGGMRASIYNAMPIEGVEGLVKFMDDFARANPKNADAV